MSTTATDTRKRKAGPPMKAHTTHFDGLEGDYAMTMQRLLQPLSEEHYVDFELLQARSVTTGDPYSEVFTCDGDSDVYFFPFVHKSNNECNAFIAANLDLSAFRDLDDDERQQAIENIQVRPLTIKGAVQTALGLYTGIEADKLYTGSLESGDLCLKSLVPHTKNFVGETDKWLSELYRNTGEPYDKKDSVYKALGDWLMDFPVYGESDSTTEHHRRLIERCKEIEVEMHEILTAEYADGKLKPVTLPYLDDLVKLRTEFNESVSEIDDPDIVANNLWMCWKRMKESAKAIDELQREMKSGPKEKAVARKKPKLGEQ